MTIKATEINKATTQELKTIKTGLEKQLTADQIRPYEKEIIKMHLDEINKEIAKRG